jgi:purine nucleosidase
MAIALDPTICTSASPHHVEIECASDLTRGQTVVDRLNVTDDDRNRGVWSKLRGRPRNVSVCWTIDIARWKALLYQALAE